MGARGPDSTFSGAPAQVRLARPKGEIACQRGPRSTQRQRGVFERTSFKNIQNYDKAPNECATPVNSPARASETIQYTL
jgi:hypothetical protein